LVVDEAEVFVAGRGGRWRLVAGALVVVVSAVWFVVFHAAASEAEPVLVVARPVQVGQLIGAADVRVEQVMLPAGVASVSGSDVDLVVGRSAAVPLVAGMLLAPGHVGSGVVPAVGEVLVAVAVPLPPAGLAPGARVRVLVTPTAAAVADAAGVGSAGGLLSAGATVVQVGAVDGVGVRVVSLSLPAADGEPVAAAAAAGRVSIVVEAAG
jgi:hypothetical protein